MGMQDELSIVKEKLRIKQKEMEDMISSMALKEETNEEEEEIIRSMKNKSPFSVKKKVSSRSKKTKRDKSITCSKFYKKKVTEKSLYGKFIKRAHETQQVSSASIENGGSFYGAPSIIKSHRRNRSSSRHSRGDSVSKERR